MTPEEIAESEKIRRRGEIAEKSRPFTESEVSRMLIAAQVNTLEVDDNTALRMLVFYPEWAENTGYTVGFKVRRSGKLWRALQSHTSSYGWEPENAPALWAQINETHSGTAEDPIPYGGNMVLESGKYYVQNYALYLCTRDTGMPVHHALADMLGLYVEAV
jgi:hypothetical protein